MLCFELQNRLCPDWERGVWHPGAGWCAVARAFSLPLKRSVIHQGLGWRGDGSAVRWLMQRAALGFAACSAGRCSALRRASQRAPSGGERSCGWQVGQMAASSHKTAPKKYPRILRQVSLLRFFMLPASVLSRYCWTLFLFII